MKGKEDPRFITIFIFTVVAHFRMKKNTHLLKLYKVDRGDLLKIELSITERSRF